MSKVDEAGFESFICDWLVGSGGYDEVKFGTAQGTPADFDPVRGLDAVELLRFIGATQNEAWQQLLTLYGNDVDKAQASFMDRLAR